MPFADFRCPSCSLVVEYLAYPMPEYDAAHTRTSPWPRCPCGADLEVFPRRMQHDLMTGGTGLSIELDGRTHVFASAHEMRRHSEESLKRARNGEGQALVFRALEQNRGNMDRNTLSGSDLETGKQVPVDSFKRTRTGLPITGGAVKESDG